MTRKSLAAALCVGAAAALVAAAAPESKSGAAAGPSVERGRYLVTIMGCNDCHTPWKMGANGIPEPDMSRMLSGHPEQMKLPPPPPPQGPWLAQFAATQTAYAGPWGVSYAINLTPDKNTGVGGGVWSEQTFLKALRTGKHFGTSRQIQPPMPWFWIGKATDDDLKSMWAYLQSIPPIANHVPEWQEPKGPPPGEKKAPPKKN